MASPFHAAAAAATMPPPVDCDFCRNNQLPLSDRLNPCPCHVPGLSEWISHFLQPPANVSQLPATLPSLEHARAIVSSFADEGQLLKAYAHIWMLAVNRNFVESKRIQSMSDPLWNTACLFFLLDLAILGMRDQNICAEVVQALRNVKLDSRFNRVTEEQMRVMDKEGRTRPSLAVRNTREMWAALIEHTSSPQKEDDVVLKYTTLGALEEICVRLGLGGLATWSEHMWDSMLRQFTDKALETQARLTYIDVRTLQGAVRSFLIKSIESLIPPKPKPKSNPTLAPLPSKMLG